MAANNAAALAELDLFIRHVQNLTGFAKEAAPLVAVAVRRELTLNVEAAVGPDGNAWELTEDGQKPLRNAMGAVKIEPIGATVLITLTGVEARHHHGWVKGGIARPIIPTEDIPDPMAIAIRKVVERKFDELMGGA